MGTSDQGPPLVVCDAGPLIHLDELDALGLLSDFAEVLVPDAVWREVERHRPRGDEASPAGDATRGMQVNDPAEQYSLNSIPGKFSGLHLPCIEYVGFKLIDPSVDLGFDLTAEYAAACKIHGKP